MPRTSGATAGHAVGPYEDATHLVERVVERADGARILVIEDNRDAAESLAALLDVFGYSVQVASDGPSGLTLAQQDAPDLMLVDIGLPGMDGYAVARRVRADARLAGVMLVALTGYGYAEDREAALDAGFDCHLVKPVEPTTLEEVLAQHVAGRARAADHS